MTQMFTFSSPDRQRSGNTRRSGNTKRASNAGHRPTIGTEREQAAHA